MVFIQAEDPELAELRKKRLAQLQQEQGGQDQSKIQQQQERLKAAEEQRDSILAQILTSEARERLHRVRLVRPETYEVVANHIVQMSQTGQIRSKVDNAQIIGILEQVQQATKKETKIQFQRKGESPSYSKYKQTRCNDDSDESDVDTDDSDSSSDESY